VSPFVLIKPGTQNPPVFIAHGLAGTVQFSELVKHIRTRNPIYGIQAKGVDGREEPFERIEEMAAFYLDALNDLQIKEPYILIGYSFGGLVSLEMAQRLSHKSNQVALLILMDTFPHPRFMPVSQRLRMFVRRMISHAHRMKQLSFAGAFSYFSNGLKRRLHFPGAIHDALRPPETLGLSFAETALRRVNQKAYSAYRSYRPRIYRGKIKFVATEEKTFFPGDPATVWGDLSTELDVEIVPGNHLSLVTTQYEPLAAVLTRWIKQVNSSHDQVASNI
jgi:acetoacetyl-CoA synthetase